jgi:hypothetical protein
MTEKEIADLKAEYFDGRASDYQGLFDFLRDKGVSSKDFKRFKNGGLARRKRSIARGCGAIMENRRKKTLYT